MDSVIRGVIHNFNNRIEEPVRHHLRNVYACLTLSTLLAAAGAYVHIFTNILSAGLFSTLAAVGLLITLYCTPDNGKNMNMRLGYLLGFAFFTGMGMGPLLDFVIRVDPSIIVSALVGTVVIFASFTLSVLFSQRGYWLFLFGPLSTILSTLLLLSFANILFGSYLLYQLNLYLGLVAMCGFVIYDTCLIMEKRRMGDKDFVTHSIDLFIDFIGIFKRILIILTEKEDDRRRRRRD